MKVLMIGNKASGKTTYMGCAYGELRQTVAGFKLYAHDYESHDALMRIHTGVKYGEYPHMTDKRSQWKFDIAFEDEKLLDLEWIDWNGGVITERSVEQLSRDANDADSIYIFLEAASLVHVDDENAQLDRILGILGSKLISCADDRKPLDVQILLTQCDASNPNEIHDYWFDEISNFLSLSDENEFIHTALVPVACCADLGNVNVDYPLLRTIFLQLDQKCNECMDVLDYARSKRDEALRKADVSIIDGVFIGATFGLAGIPKLLHRSKAKHYQKGADAVLRHASAFLDAYDRLGDEIAAYEINWMEDA